MLRNMPWCLNESYDGVRCQSAKRFTRNLSKDHLPRNRFSLSGLDELRSPWAEIASEGAGVFKHLCRVSELGDIPAT